MLLQLTLTILTVIICTGIVRGGVFLVTKYPTIGMCITCGIPLIIVASTIICLIWAVIGELLEKYYA